MKPKSESVKVAIRVRPMNSREKQEKSTICISVDNTNNTVSATSSKNETKTFQFDYVYDMDSTQRQVYDEVAFPIVDSIFQGYNGTVFAYGQTGCGKTFTMMGIINDPNLRGVVPNAFDHIFGYIKTEGTSKKFLVRCSFVEIYNEEVRDLLSKSDKALEVREDPKKGIFVKELTYISISNTNDIQKCLERGNNNRHVGATSMNDKSSRSHSLFTVYLEIEEGEEKNKKIRSGKLNLVDLAGSERVGKKNETGKTFDEGKKINLSLTALGSVIDALASNRKHIPYKDSKLTRLLADSLGGNTKTVMFANVSPASFNYEETVGTLRYASRAKLIKNAPKINEDPKDALLRKYEEEIKALKAQLGNNGIGNNVNLGVESNGNDEEKEMLLRKIKELESGMINGNNNNIIISNNNNNKEEMEKIERENEEERRKFKEYREQQIKNAEEMEKKYQKLEEEKKKEEEELHNNMKKLQERVKYLSDEIEDLKYDNEKDRADFLENIKGINRDNMLYKGIIKYLLSDVELRKIIDMSRYNEDNDTWKIHPFTIREKQLLLPNVKPSQIPTFIEGNLHRREILMDDNNNGRSNRFEDNDYDNDDCNNNGDSNYDNLMRESKFRKDYSLDKNNSMKKLVLSNEKLKISKKPINFSSNIRDNKLYKKESTDNIFRGNQNNISVNNTNISILMQKEREKYEQLKNISPINNNNNSLMNSSSHRKIISLKPIKKQGKLVLDPIRGGNANKLEVSFKATLELGGYNPIGNNLRLSQINEHEQENY